MISKGNCSWYMQLCFGTSSYNKDQRKAVHRLMEKVRSACGNREDVKVDEGQPSGKDVLGSFDVDSSDDDECDASPDNGCGAPPWWLILGSPPASCWAPSFKPSSHYVTGNAVVRLNRFKKSVGSCVRSSSHSHLSLISKSFANESLVVTLANRAVCLHVSPQADPKVDVFTSGSTVRARVWRH